MTTWAPSGIPTCDVVWNPFRGCTRGCPHCWARAVVRLHAKGLARIEANFSGVYEEWLHHFENFSITTIPTQFEKLKNYAPQKPKRIFVGSQTDISCLQDGQLRDVELAIIKDNRKRINANLPLHQFQFLTQEPAVYRKMNDFPANCWFGITAMNATELEQKRRDYRRFTSPDEGRIDYVYLEPLTGKFAGVKHWTIYPAWIVVGGMSRQNKVKPIMADLESMRNIRDWAKEFDIPFFFKGWGAIVPPGQEPSKLDGVEYHEFPPSVEVV